MSEGQEKAMGVEQTTIWESAILLILCSIIALAGLGVTVWVVATWVFLSLDGLLLTTTCLVLALAFGGNVVWSFRSGEAQSILKGLFGSAKDEKK